MVRARNDVRGSRVARVGTGTTDSEARVCASVRDKLPRVRVVTVAFDDAGPGPGTETKTDMLGMF